MLTTMIIKQLLHYLSYLTYNNRNCIFWLMFRLVSADTTTERILSFQSDKKASGERVANLESINRKLRADVTVFEQEQQALLGTLRFICSLLGMTAA